MDAIRVRRKDKTKPISKFRDLKYFSLYSQRPPVPDILLSALVVAPLCQATYASHQLISSDWWLGGVGCRLLGGNFLSFHGSFPYSDSSVRTEMTGAGRHAGLVIVRTWRLMDFVFYKNFKNIISTARYTWRKSETRTSKKEKTLHKCYCGVSKFPWFWKVNEIMSDLWFLYFFE